MNIDRELVRDIVRNFFGSAIPILAGMILLIFYWNISNHKFSVVIAVGTVVVFMGLGITSAQALIRKRKLVSLISTAFMLAITMVPFSVHSAKQYLVVLYSGGYEIIKPVGSKNIGGYYARFLSPLDLWNAKEIKVVPIEKEERDFYIKETGSYYFLDLRVASKLIDNKEETIFRAATRQSIFDDVPDAVKDYIFEQIKLGITDWLTLEKKALAHFKKNPVYLRIPTKIKIESLEYVK